MGPEINSFRSPGASPIMTTGSVQVQANGCLSTMGEYEIKGIEVPIGVSLENGFDQLSRDVELQSKEEKELEIEDSEDDDEIKDDERENDSMIFGNYVAAKQFLEELERKSGIGSYSGAVSYGDRYLSYGDDSQKVDRQIVSGSDKEVNTNEQGGAKGLFDSVALAALLKIATIAVVLDGNKLENQVPPLVLYVIPQMHANFVNPNFQPITSVQINYALPKCCRYGKDIGKCSVVNVLNALCVRLKHYIEGSKNISNHVLQLCFSGFDKKVRDKGSTLLTDEPFMEYFAGTMSSGNSLKFTFSQIMTLIELWSYGYVEKNKLWFTKISVISFGNGCLDFHHDHGLISSGIEFNSFLVSKNDGCIVVLYQNMNEEDDMEEIELPPEVCDLFNGDWIFEPVTHPLYKEDECEFLTAQVTCMMNGRRNSMYQHWRWQPRDCNLPKFNARLLLEKLRNKRLVFVGDSLNRNQRESIICFAQSVISPGRKSLVTNGSLSVFRIENYNTTVKFKWEIKGSGNLLMLAHPRHVKLLMNDIEVVHKGIKPFF
ncbi:putative PMR5 domain, PC-Esterase [Rosa chinensis]|uniref:Putative PMR5 domain, PC-Esterase n=1 Tax=Rosa chinensis TaxID=74649 RepID=A0A2P6R467_ROSCH|nr:putative PMR5 domain, PC-Esterase [Rosa chinensis]